MQREVEPVAVRTSLRAGRSGLVTGPGAWPKRLNIALKPRRRGRQPMDKRTDTTFALRYDLKHALVAQPVDSEMIVDRENS